VVKSEENTNQWTGITTRLQVAVAYCVIDPPAVKSAADLGDRVKVVFPNDFDTGTSNRARRMDEPGWAGNCQRSRRQPSQPGVRQLLRSLGAYWDSASASRPNCNP